MHNDTAPERTSSTGNSPLSDNGYHGFLVLSALLTGFSERELAESKLGPDYFDELQRQAPRALTTLLNAYAQQANHPSHCLAWLEKRILPSASLGPLAQGIIRLWFTGQWFPLQTREVIHPIYHGDAADRDELIWQAIHAHLPPSRATSGISNEASTDE
ncbi:hypothetical protein [Musicola paradisiaca]|uniref:Uncharacterized protein n=1 Tax=Musicola paradisiaca (strain Ech703) TaxID=579405 RepID=C6C561_MUSP7|nr:hypothetical protein [Musicola paradisiaca]ACS85671.1 hypothetical protein Dd703_1878 [Musicola paradisiaca Ech703]